MFATVAPLQVLKEAFAAKIISDGQVWIHMLDHRNLLAHTYDKAGFELAVEAIHLRYLAGFASLHELWFFCAVQSFQRQGFDPRSYFDLVGPHPWTTAAIVRLGWRPSLECAHRARPDRHSDTSAR